jgi:hypothetical protein
MCSRLLFDGTAITRRPNKRIHLLTSLLIVPSVNDNVIRLHVFQNIDPALRTAKPFVSLDHAVHDIAIFTAGLQKVLEHGNKHI